MSTTLNPDEEPQQQVSLGPSAPIVPPVCFTVR
jgi:hypothetical protein